MISTQNEHFFKISKLHHGITMLDERISAASWQGPQRVENDDTLAELGKEAGWLNLSKLRRILSEGSVGLARIKTFRESLVAKLRVVYQQFADKEFESLSELREDSSIGGPAEQCAFAITAVLDSFASQFEDHVDRKNLTVELLLEFSDDLGLPDQAKGGPAPPSGLDVVRLAEGIGTPCNGVRIGNDELRSVDEAQAVTKFINQIASVTRDLIGEASSSERSQTVEHEIFSVSEECGYAYGEAVFPSKVGDDKR